MVASNPLIRTLLPWGVVLWGVVPLDSHEIHHQNDIPLATGRSHSFDQRLSASHPDPDGKQLAVLREAFERIITKQLQVTWMPIGVQWELRSGSHYWCRCIVND